MAGVVQFDRDPHWTGCDLNPYLVVGITDGENTRSDPYDVLGGHRARWRTGIYFNFDLEWGYELVRIEALQIDVLSMPHWDHQARVGPGGARVKGLSGHVSAEGVHD